MANMNPQKFMMFLYQEIFNDKALLKKLVEYLNTHGIDNTLHKNELDAYFGIAMPDPKYAVRPDGSALQSGDFFIDNIGIVYVFSGGAWHNPPAPTFDPTKFFTKDEVNNLLTDYAKKTDLADLRKETLADYTEQMIYHESNGKKFIIYKEAKTGNVKQVIEIVAVAIPGTGDILTYQTQLDIKARLTNADASFGGTSTVDGTTILTYQNPGDANKKFSFELTKGQKYTVSFDGHNLHLITNGILKVDGVVTVSPASIAADDYLQAGKSAPLIQLPTGTFVEGTNVLQLDYVAHLQTFLSFLNKEIEYLSKTKQFKEIESTTAIAAGVANPQFLFIDKDNKMKSVTEGDIIDWIPSSTFTNPPDADTQIFIGDESTGFDPVIVNGNFGDVLQVKELNGGVIDNTKFFKFKYHLKWPDAQAPDHYQGKPYWSFEGAEDHVDTSFTLTPAQKEVINALPFTQAEKNRLLGSDGDSHIKNSGGYHSETSFGGGAFLGIAKDDYSVMAAFKFLGDIANIRFRDKGGAMKDLPIHTINSKTMTITFDDDTTLDVKVGG